MRRRISSLLLLASYVSVQSFLSRSIPKRASCIFSTPGGASNNAPEEEWHPSDPAYTTPQLLEGIWFQIAQGKNMVKGDSITVLYPQMEQDLNNPTFLNVLFGHLDVCKDVCDHFGITTTLVPYKRPDDTVIGFTVKSFRDPEQPTEGEYQFDYDPFWDDGTDFEALYDGIDDEDMVPDKFPTIETLVPDSDDEIVEISKNWVDAVVSDMGVCPFAQSAERAGLPVGDVFYTVSRCSNFEDMYTTFWKEVTRLEQNNEKEVSTTLLIAPEFCMDNIELFDTFCNTLTQPLTALDIEDLLQLVFFHPNYTFRDGDARQTAAANYARRSPWPMFNLLRTRQVRAAQKGIPTGLVYKQNEKTLSNIGVDSLETMLRLRNWEDTAAFKVNRKEIDALKIAQDFQEMGQVAEQDTTFEYDSTPVANKVNDGGNLVKVLLQALERRLGKDDNDAIIGPLTGPVTSAAALATDALLDELYVRATATEPPIPPTESLEDGTPAEVEHARQLRMAAARAALRDDFQDPSEAPISGRGDELQDVLFGRGGVGASNNDEENDFPEGMDPRSFY